MKITLNDLSTPIRKIKLAIFIKSLVHYAKGTL